jgi:hypothetical protein
MAESTTTWNPRTVGIALAAYQPNAGWLAEQLASIAAQTHTDWHCVLTFDSPMSEMNGDPTLAPYLRDPRFTWVQNEERLGVRKNFEKAASLVAALGVDLIAFSDQDDLWLPEKLAVSVATIERTGPLSLVHTDAYLLVNGELLSETIHSTHRITGSTLELEEMIIYPTVSGYLMVLDADLVRRHPNIPEAMRYHDHWYSVVATSYGGVTRITEPLAFDRQHENNTVGIASVRVANGLSAIKVKISGQSSARQRALLNIGSARQCAIELPMSRTKRPLMQHPIGWALLMLSVIVRRSFSERLLVVQAYRAFIGQLLVFPSQVERGKRIRSRVPFRGKLLRLLVLLFVAALGISVILNLSVALEAVTSAAPLLWFGIAVAALFSPAWRLARHGHPDAGQSLVGLSAVAAGLTRVVTDSAELSLLAFALPVAWYLAYRIRWRGDTGF